MLDAPRGVLTEELKSRIGELKPQLLDALRREQADAPPVATPPSPTSPLSSAQERLWFLSRLAPENPAYNVSGAILLEGELHREALHEAFAEVVRRHEILRTRFAFTDGGPVQTVDDRLDLDLAGSSHDSLAAAVEEAEAQARRPFDLAVGPLIRTRLSRVPGGHLLVVVLHHIICDAWSTAILAQEVAALYATFQQALPPSLARPALQYRDYVAWQRGRLTREALARARAHWSGRLAGAPDLLRLPVDRPRPELFSYRGDAIARPVPGDLTAALDRLSRELGVTPFAVHLSAYHALLHRFTGQEDVLVGYPVAGRHHLGLERMIGLVVNTLVDRAGVDPRMPFRQLVERTGESVLEALGHQDLPFEMIVEASKPRRQLDRAPLCQAVLVAQNVPRATPAFRGLTARPVRLRTGTAKFDLTLSVEAGESGEELCLEYASDLFDRRTAEQLLESHLELLAGAMAAPDTAVGALPLGRPVRSVPAPEPSTTPGRPPQLLDALFAEQVALGRHRGAVTDESGTLTYGQLADRSDAIRRLLAGRGVGPGSLVGVFMSRTTDLVAALLAVLRAGGAYLPLDPVTAPERLELILDDARPALIVTEPALAPRIRPGTPVVLLDRSTAPPPEDEPPLPPVAIDPDDVAYVMYTSGSTGRPGGVAVTHRNVASFLSASRAIHGGGEDDVWSLFHSVAFDFSVWEAFGALTRGGRLWIVPWEVSRDPAALHDRIVTQRVTVLSLTPTAFQGYSREAIRSPRAHGLGCLVLSGEALDVQMLRDWFDRFGDESPRVVNAYGITETTVMVTCRELARGDVDGPVQSPIGRALPGLTVSVTDPLGAPVPPGFVGEITVGGPTVARGYLDRPERPSLRFVQLPGHSGRLYRSGDLGRLRHDGELEYLGRRDGQVKVRGHRIELGEVEMALRRHPAVRDVAVCRRDDLARGAGLAAFLVSREIAPLPDELELRRFLQSRLDAPMIPDSFTWLDQLPLTPNGKLDRRALPEVAAAKAASRPRPAPPTTEMERLLVGIFRELLRVDRVGTRDNFFDLGVHSLLLVEAHRRIQDRLCRRIELVDLFRHPTIHDLAGHLAGGAPVDVPGRRRSRSDDPGLPGSRAISGDVAVVGMAGRFPGAPDLDAFWDNLCAGRETVSFFTDEELLQAGVDEKLLRDRRYVKACGFVEGVEMFDAAFFGFSPREAQLMDPQHRLFLECCFHALESSGHAGRTAALSIGVFASAGLSRYLLFNLAGRADDASSLLAYQAQLGNDKDFLATRVSYALGLTGPSVSVQSACSSSLVAVHLARRSLLDGECDLALAGGVTLQPWKAGYLYHEGAIASPDGHCRPFDARAAGTVGGSGLGVVVLRPLEAALGDGDPIHAVIRGSAVNNDGSRKVGYTAPSVEAQAEVVRAALDDAGIDPETLGLLEAHGTATPLGDPIEVQALRLAFGRCGPAGARCALGSVKSNLGHLDAAAGIAGLIKAILAVKHGQIPRSLNYQEPNPRIDLSGSPFFVNDALRPFHPDLGPRRGGVSSFGMGGTNAHVIVEEPPAAPAVAPSGPEEPALLIWSAKTEGALARLTESLAGHLDRHRSLRLADVARTLLDGRVRLHHRAFLVASSVADAADALTAPGRPRVRTGIVPDITPDLPDRADGPDRPDARWLASQGELWLVGHLEPGQVAPSASRTVELPLYPFERQRFWIDRLTIPRGSPAPPDLGRGVSKPGGPADAVPRFPDPGDWLYLPSYRRVTLPPAPREPTTWLLFCGPSDEERELAKAIRDRSGPVITAVPGAEFSRLAPGAFALRPGSAEDHRALLSDLAARGELPRRILHLWNAAPHGHDRDDTLERPYFSLVALAQAFDVVAGPGRCRAVVVSRGLQPVLGDEPLVPSRATLLGPILVIPLEHPRLDTVSLDLAPDAGLDPEMLLEVALAPAGEAQLARRGRTWWAPTWERCARSGLPAGPPGPWKDRGVYVITGGAGGIGLALAERLARRHQARLVLVSRSAGSPSRELEEIVERLAGSGSTVRLHGADVSRAEAMEQVFERTVREFGKIDGVVHAAGLPGGELVRSQTRERTAPVFAAKLEGTLVLERLCRVHEPEFLALCSSLNSSSGTVGQVAYVAASAFLDLFAAAHRTLGKTRTLVLNLGAFSETGMASRVALSRLGLERLEEAHRRFLEQGIPTDQGLGCLEAALLSGHGRVAISPHDLVTLLAHQREITLERVAREPGGAAGARPEVSRRSDGIPGVASGMPTDLETVLIEVWKECLGVPDVGVNDSFFDLGGDSLVLLETKGVLERRLGREVPLGALLAGSTIGQIASALGSVPSGLLVKLREGDGTRQPLVLIHAISGTVFPFVPLAASLAAGREVHALQARGLLGDQPPHETLDSMAADYAREIRRVQPNGPYGILGWSFGCTVALAVARLLTLEGETVAPLVMVDGPAPIGRESPGENEQALRERFRAEVAALTAGSTGPLPALDEELLFRVFRANVGIAHGAPRQRAGKPDGLVGRYGGPVVLFRASEGSSATLEPRDLDWGLIQPEVTVVWLPGDHYSMLREPAVRSLAAAVDALLAPASGTPVPG